VGIMLKFLNTWVAILIILIAGSVYFITKFIQPGHSGGE